MDIFDEIKADLDRERFAGLWERYGYIMLAAIVAVILATAATVWWKNHHREQQEQLGNRFEHAVSLVKKNDISNALAMFDSLATESKGDVGVMVLLNKASLLVKQGKQDDALQLYDAIGIAKAGDPVLKELGMLLGAYFRMEMGKEVDKAVLVLDNLVKQDSAWKASAMELKALYLLGNGENEQAKTLLLALKNDEATPSDMKARAMQIEAGL